MLAFFVLLLSALPGAPQTVPVQQLPESPFNPPYAAITYAPADTNSQPVTVFTPAGGAKFALVGLQPGQAVNVIVQYPQSDALQVVSLEAMDGGAILPPVTLAPATAPAPSPPPLTSKRAASLPTDNNAALSFVFVAGNAPGNYRVTLRVQGQSQALVLQFYAFDSQNPQNNPGCITATTPDY